MALALLLALAAACTDDTPATIAPRSMTPAAAASPKSIATLDERAQDRTPAATPTPASGAASGTATNVPALRAGDPVELPEKMALIVETGCFRATDPPLGCSASTVTAPAGCAATP